MVEQKNNSSCNPVWIATSKVWTYANVPNVWACPDYDYIILNIRRVQ